LRSDARAIALFGSLLLAACEGNVCVRESDCTSGLACRAGHCIVITDANVADGGDAGSDAGRDAGHDAAVDSAVDAAAIRDTSPDTATDAAVGTDAGTDAS
jgi:hypothetical protein